MLNVGCELTIFADGLVPGRTFQHRYRSAEIAKTYVEGLREFRRHGKPVVIKEFCCGSFTGADLLGAGSHDEIDFTASPLRLKRSHVRDESVQANYIGDLIRLYREEAIAGAFAFEFIGPSCPHSPDPLSDVDMAGYSVVKSLPDDRWEPTAAFEKIAQLYGMP